MASALSDKSKEVVENLQNRPLSDMFTTEMEMLEAEEISEKVRQQIISKWGSKFQDLILVLGRRSGKSFMVSVIALYEVYRFLMMEHPQARYPLTEFDTLGLEYLPVCFL
jgi:DNA-binding transcriptional ArsR family regulator